MNGRGHKQACSSNDEGTVTGVQTMIPGGCIDDRRNLLTCKYWSSQQQPPVAHWKHT
jgi:hypothetical protein